MLSLKTNSTLPAYVHNIALAKLATYPSFPNFELEEGYQAGVSSLNDVLNPGTTPFDTPKYDDVREYYELLANGSTSSEILNLLLEKGLINGKEKEALDELDNVIQNRESLDEFDSNINEYIFSIENNSALTKDEKLLCISCANISIASKNFWVNAANDIKSPWNFLFPEDSGVASRGIWKWLKKVLITVACDVVGGAIGFGLGSIASPAAGVAAMAMVGAGASAAATKFQE
ncbi:MAG: hypothetical protein ACK4HE_06865 [Chitinophagaceae bacterium]